MVKANLQAEEEEGHQKAHAVFIAHGKTSRLKNTFLRWRVSSRRAPALPIACGVLGSDSSGPHADPIKSGKRNPVNRPIMGRQGTPGFRSLQRQCSNG